MKRAAVLAGAVSSLVLWTSAFAFHARADVACAITDLSCTTGAIGDTVGQAQGTIDQISGSVEGTAGAIVQTGTSALGHALHTVGHLFHRVTGHDPGGGTHDPGNGSGGGGAQHPPGPVGHGGNRHHHSTHGARGSVGAGTTLSTQPTPGASASVVSAGHDPVTKSPLVQAVTQAAVGATLLILVIGLIVGFVLVQDRIDARDPRLAPSSFGSDRVAFG